MIKYTRELVIRKVKQAFSVKQFENIMRILDQYGSGQHEAEKERLQLAALKLCQGNEEKLKNDIEYAKRIDQRDIIRLAEYPRSNSATPNFPDMKSEDIKKLEEQDLQEYLDWLNK